MRRFWTQEECDLLRKYYLSKSVAELAQQLSWSQKTIRSKAYRLGITHGEFKQTQNEFYSKSELAKLRELYRSHASRQEIAEKLGRSVNSITSRANRLGLHRRYRSKRAPYINKPWTPTEVATLRKLYPTTEKAELLNKLNRSPHAVNQKAIALGLSKCPVARRRKYLQGLREKLSLAGMVAASRRADRAPAHR